MMLGRFRSTRDPRDPMMNQYVKSARKPIRGLPLLCLPLVPAHKPAPVPAATDLVRANRRLVRAAPRVNAREPIELVARSNPRGSAAMYVCPVCHLGYGINTVIGTEDVRRAYAYEQAMRCCRGRCVECQTPTKKYNQHCEACADKRFKARKEEWAARAKVVPFDENGWFYCDHYTNHNEGYFNGFDELLEYLIEHDETDEDGELPDLPPYVMPCRPVTVSLSIEHIEESISEDVSWDDCEPLDLVKGLDALRTAVETFNAANADNYFAWEADYRRVVIFDADYFNTKFGGDLNGLPNVSWSDRPPSIRPHIAQRYRERVRVGRAKAAAWSAKFNAELRAKYPHLYSEETAS